MGGIVSPARVVLRGQVAILSHPLAAFSSADSVSLPGRVADQNDLAGLYLKGVRRLLLWTGETTQDTADERAALTRLGRACTGLNTVLASRGVAPMKFRQIPPDHPSSAAMIDALETPSDMGKRRVFGRLADDVTRLAVDAEPLPLAQIQAVTGEGARFAASPGIDPSKCSGCDACSRVCPEGVLTLINAGETDLRYRIEPENCTGCRLCLDVCDHEAVTLSECAPRRPDIVLQTGQCSACGVAFHEPGAAQDLCQICRVTNHHKKLFQVLS